MARKTNKTAHVLNLISKAKEEHQTADEDNNDIEVNQVNTTTSDLSFINEEITNDRELGEKIRENLSKTVEAEKSHSHADEVDENDNNTMSDNSTDTCETTDIIENNTYIISKVAANPDISADKSDFEKAKPKEEFVINTIEKETVSNDISINEQKNTDTSDTTDLGFSYVNVLEEVVRLRVDEFLDMFDVCKCPRCKADVIALALNNLPSKYIVVEKAHVSPLLNFFSNQYSGAVTAQLSRACTVVKDNPNH